VDFEGGLRQGEGAVQYLDEKDEAMVACEDRKFQLLKSESVQQLVFVRFYTDLACWE
jgi:hypothetical protein